MKTNLFSIVFLFLFCLRFDAQITFQKTYGSAAAYEFGMSVQQSNDGGFIVSGASWEASRNCANVIKTNSNGDTIFTKTYFNGWNSLSLPNCIEQTSDGGYIITGGEINSAFSNIRLLKIDSNGDTLWVKSFVKNPQITNFSTQGYSVQQTSDSGFIIGATALNGVPPTGTLIKINSIGDTLWTKGYGFNSTGMEIHSVTATNDGGYIAVGFSPPTICLIKTNSIGDTLWTKTYSVGGRTIAISGGSSNGKGNRFIQQTSDGGYIVTGVIFGGSGNGDFYLLKLDSNGNPIWSKSYGGLNFDSSYSVQQTTDGGYLMAGIFQQDTSLYFQDACLIKTNSSGDTLWTKLFGGSGLDAAYDGQQTFDGGYVLTGVLNGDIYLIKTDLSGNSGCLLQRNPNLIVSNVATIISNSLIPVSSGLQNSSLTFSVNSGTIVTDPCTIAGVDFGISKSIRLQVYPNPFSSETTFKTDEFLKGANLIIYNSWGQQVNQIKNISGQTLTLLRDNLSSGVYFIQLKQDNQLLAVEKLVISE